MVIVESAQRRARNFPRDEKTIQRTHLSVEFGNAIVSKQRHKVKPENGKLALRGRQRHAAEWDD